MVEQCLYTSDGKRFDTNEVFLALEHMDGLNPALDNIIFYVHGRGKEPGKSISKVMPKLASEYSAKVLMFHWGPSYDGPLGHPSAPAGAAGTALCSCIRQFGDAMTRRSSEIKKTALVHSMGNIVFAEAISKCGCDKVSENIFDTVVLSAADVDTENHYSWVEKIGLSNNVYITINEHDPILFGSTVVTRSKKLGRSIDDSIQLATNAIYIDVSETGVGHRYFLASGQQGNQYLKKLFSSILNGDAFIVGGWNGIRSTKQGNGNIIYLVNED